MSAEFATQLYYNAITFDLFFIRVEHLAPKYHIHHYLLSHNFTNTFQCKNNALREKKQGVLQLMSKAKRKCHCLVYFPRRTSIKSPSCFVGVPHFFLLYVFRLVFLGELYRLIFKTGFEQKIPELSVS